MKQLIYILIFIIVCTSCIYSSVTHLSKDDRKWIDCFSISTNQYYESDSNKVDTLYVTRKYIHNATNRFYFSEGGTGRYEANSGCWYSLRHSGSIIEGWISVRRVADNDTLQINSILKYREAIKPNGFADCISIKSDTININEFIYPDCMVFDETNSEYGSYRKNEPNKIVKFIYSKHYGLIYYKFENGEEYFLRRKK